MPTILPKIVFADFFLCPPPLPQNFELQKPLFVFALLSTTEWWAIHSFKEIKTVLQRKGQGGEKLTIDYGHWKDSGVGLKDDFLVKIIDMKLWRISLNAYTGQNCAMWKNSRPHVSLFPSLGPRCTREECVEVGCVGYDTPTSVRTNPLNVCLHATSTEPSVFSSGVDLRKFVFHPMRTFLQEGTYWKYRRGIARHNTPLCTLQVCSFETATRKVELVERI